MEQVNKTTYKQTAGAIEAVVGDEKQKDFFPRVKIKKWNNEVNFSIGLKNTKGKHKKKGDKIVFTAGKSVAEFYPVNQASDPKFDTSHIRFIKQGLQSPEQIAARYELDRYFDWSAQTIMYHIPNRPSMMYYGYYHRSSYIDPKKLNIPECRVAATGPKNNPMYMDSGLLLIDIHYDERRDDLAKIGTSITQAATDVVESYGIKVTQKGGKLYFKHQGNEVKFFSGAFIDGHYYFYINLSCDYNKAYNYYKDGVIKDIRDHKAYGLRALKSDIPDTIAEEVVKRYAKLYGLPLKESSLTKDEKTQLDELTSHHTEPEWIDKAERQDVYKFNRQTAVDGFEFSVTLQQKPATNILPLTIQTKDLRFFYQPELTAEEAMNRLRPNNVVGSYAVYHASKTNNEYTTGKAFHIYRPWAEDATGKKVWCELQMDVDGNGFAKKDEISIIVPQDFINSAKYPVLIDPTFGYTTAGGSSLNIADVNAGNTAIDTLLNQTPGEVGVGSSMSAYIQVFSSGNSVNYKYGMYNSTTNQLAGQTTTSASFTTAQASAWQTLNFNAVTATDLKPTTPDIRNVMYDLAVWGAAASAYEFAAIGYDTQTNAAKSYIVTGSATIGTWPQNIVSGTSSNSTLSDRISIYTTYTASTGSTIFRLSENDASNTSSTSSVTATYNVTPTQNNLLLAAVFSNKPTGNNAISGWTTILDQSINANANSVTLFAKIAGSGESTSVTASATSATVMNIAVFEYTGNVSTSVAAAQDAAASGQTVASGTSASTPTATTSTANDILIAVIGFSAGTFTGSASWNNSFGMIGAAARLLVGERIVSATGSYSSTATWTTGRTTATIIATFKASSIAATKKISSLGVG